MLAHGPDADNIFSGKKVLFMDRHSSLQQTIFINLVEKSNGESVELEMNTAGRRKSAIFKCRYEPDSLVNAALLARRMTVGTEFKANCEETFIVAPTKFRFLIKLAMRTIISHRGSPTAAIEQASPATGQLTVTACPRFIETDLTADPPRYHANKSS